MPKQVLLTSFAPWKPEQASNASDDLLQALFSDDCPPAHIHLLRKVPVDFDLAPVWVIQRVQTLQPDWVICLGMAETRTRLEIEVQATYQGHQQQTSANLSQLLSGLSHTQLSYDAGQFVCNHLYYSVLSYLQQQNTDCQCIFVHVPILTMDTVSYLLRDLHLLLQNIGALGHDGSLI